MPGTIRRPGPCRRHGVIPPAEVDNAGIDAETRRSPVDLVFVGNCRNEALGSFEGLEVIAAVAGEVKSVGIVFTLDNVLAVALARVCPAVILGVRQSSDLDAVKGVEGREPDLVVIVGRIWVADRFECGLATVVNVLKGGPRVLEHLGARGYQVDRYAEIAERSRHRVRNVVQITRVLEGFEDNRAGAFESSRDRGSP